MNKKELSAVLESINLHPGKMLGQNFLVDANLLDFILRSAAVKPSDIVLEVGPGLGVLTRGLLNAGATVFSVEFDHRLYDFLHRELSAQFNNFTLLKADACKVDYPALLKDIRNFQAIANLPYSISSIFISKMLELEVPPQRMIFMLQKEMALRIAAKTNQSEYSSLSARTQLLYEVKILRMVPPQVFFPQPDIDSAIVQFTLRDNIPQSDIRTEIFALIKIAFTQKRKQIFKPLLAKYPEYKLSAALDELGIKPSARPGEISPQQFCKMAELLR
jgi:16S rRNA (adenine1518-N6/adenine1519-N6)-dimethyltransferase